MPADDKIHDAVKLALIKDGWTITDDPYTLDFEGEKLYADLAAERPLAAERDGVKIVVEVKSFLGSSLIKDLEAAVGQYEIYRDILQATAPERRLYLALSEEAHLRLSQRKVFQRIAEKLRLAMLVVDILAEEVVRWID
ncbi:MAG TPA: XisH family protein [Chthonomonadaceae bacterium]|nr:XisH family protein [Chthonomonadaceae bacterium]